MLAHNEISDRILIEISGPIICLLIPFICWFHSLATHGLSTPRDMDCAFLFVGSI